MLFKFVCNGSKRSRKGGTLEPPQQSSDVLCFNSPHNTASNIDRECDEFTIDYDINNYMNNLVNEEVPESVPVESLKKELLLNHIYSSGIRFDLRADMDFTYPIDNLD